ncbi:MAG: polymer-forming cytoskeletal protein [Proteobacteria bacterium]|nr:polymer-forming cytoskeletal protein [Pseudomonadota bacterium]
MFRKQGGNDSGQRETEIPSQVRMDRQPMRVSMPEKGGPNGRLTVGPDIRLVGASIEDCDTLHVEGHVEASMDSRVIHIAESGTFSGAVSVDEAEIHGRFDGELTVRDRLTVHKTGRIGGTVRYGRLSVEDGGQIAGDVGSINTPPPAMKSQEKPAEKPAATPDAPPQKAPAEAQAG